MEIHEQELPPIGTNAFLILERSRKTAFVVDAPAEAFAWASALATEHDCKIEALILTHGHWDHMAGAASMVSDDMVVVGHPDDKVLFEKPALMSSFAIPGVDFQPITITKWIEHGDKLDFWGREVEIRHCPGHCPGNIIFWIRKENICFVGDVIFSGSIGRADLPGGDFVTLEKSIQNHIYTLPAETKILPGHGPDTLVGDEIRANPFVRPL